MKKYFSVSILMGALTLALVPALAARPALGDSIWDREKLSGDWGGARTALQDKGIEVGITSINEAFAVLSGGLSRGGSVEGRTEIVIDTDLEKLLGWTGGKAHVKGYALYGTDTNPADRTGSISDPSNIDAVPTVRLFTAWFQQEFGKTGSLRVGQLAADDEFFTSATAGGLVSSTFGWPNVMGVNLPSGGPAFPLATPGARLQLNLSDSVTWLGGVFSGDPAGPHCNDHPQRCNRYGTTFSFSGGSFWITELQYQINQAKDATGLAAAYKLGAWFHTGRFAHMRFGVDVTGTVVSLARSPEFPLSHQGNWGVYGIVDQMLWRGAAGSVNVFARAGVLPSDRNLVSWYVDGGIGFKGLMPGRADDTLTFGVAHSHVSRHASDLDRDVVAVNGAFHPIRRAETVFELSYMAQVAAWWTLQPDVQYIVRPAGGAADPQVPGQIIGNAFLIGVRSTMNF